MQRRDLNRKDAYVYVLSCKNYKNPRIQLEDIFKMGADKTTKSLFCCVIKREDIVLYDNQLVLQILREKKSICVKSTACDKARTVISSGIRTTTPLEVFILCVLRFTLKRRQSYDIFSNLRPKRRRPLG